MERAALRKGKAGKSSSKKLSTDPSKKRRSSGKGQGTLAWIPANTNRCWVLGKRGDKNPEVSGDVRTPRTGIVSGTLYAHLISSATLELGGLWWEGETNITCKTIHLYYQETICLSVLIPCISTLIPCSSVGLVLLSQ